MDPAPVHTPAHTAQILLTHLSVISVYLEFLCDCSWQTRETAHPSSFLSVIIPLRYGVRSDSKSSELTMYFL